MEALMSTETDAEPVEEAIAYTRYEWDCPECGETNSGLESDPAGTVQECDFCDAPIKIRETF